MPRLTRAVPKYRRKKDPRGRLIAVVNLEGQDIILGPYRSPESYTLYDALIAEWLSNGRRLPETSLPTDQSSVPDPGPSPVPGSMLVEVREAYLAHAKQYYRKHGETTREAEMIGEVLAIVVEFYGDTPAEDFGAKCLDRVRQEMIARDWSRIYINKQIDRIKRAIKWAAGQEMFPPGPKYTAMIQLPGLAKDRSPARETPPVQPVENSVVQATLKHLSPTLADMVKIQQLTGARPGELCAMRPGDIDRSDDVWAFTYTEHKTAHCGQTRTIHIGPKGQTILKPYLLRSADSYCFSPADAECKRREQLAAARKTPLGCGNRPGTNRKRRPQRKAGDCYTTGSYRRAIHRACEKAQVEKWSPNQLRHAAATEVRKQFGLEAAQVVLGHASADVTQVYAERNRLLAEQVAVMGRYSNRNSR